MENKKANDTASDFLKKLHSAVTSGNPEVGMDAIKKINEISKLAEGMDGEVASAKFEKRVEKAGLKEVLTPEERELISLKSEKEKIKREKEEAKIKMIADIKNAEYEISSTQKELEEVISQYNKVINKQEEELRVLQIKYEARYGDEENG